MRHLRMNTKFFTQCLIIALSVCDGFKIVQSGTPEKVAETEHSNTPHQVYPRSFGIFSRHGHESRHEGSLFGHIGNVLAPVRGIIDHAKKFIPGHHQPHPARVPYDEDRHPGDHQPYQDRPNKHHHVGPNRPHQPNHERPHYERPHYEKPHYERPHERPYRPNHERPHNERPHERPHRPHHDRPHRPNHERPHRPNQERPSYDDYPDGSYDDRPNKDRPYQPGQQQPNRPDKQRPNRPDNQRPNRPDNQRPRPPIKEEVDYEDYEDTKVDKQPPSWEDIGEHPNRDIPYEDIIQPRRRPKRFIESKIYHVPLQFRSNAKPYKVKFKKEKRVAKH